MVMPRRKAGQLIAIEVNILTEALRLATAGQSHFHGFGLAKELRDGRQSHGLIAHGTLYKALSRLEIAGLLTSHLEEPQIAEAAGRPRRRLYELTGQGRLAAAQAISAQAHADQPIWHPGIEPA